VCHKLEDEEIDTTNNKPSYSSHLTSYISRNQRGGMGRNGGGGYNNEYNNSEGSSSRGALTVSLRQDDHKSMRMYSGAARAAISAAVRIRNLFFAAPRGAAVHTHTFCRCTCVYFSAQ